jgi:hypothetical protein
VGCFKFNLLIETVHWRVGRDERVCLHFWWCVLLELYSTAWFKVFGPS